MEITHGENKPPGTGGLFAIYGVVNVLLKQLFSLDLMLEHGKGGGGSAQEHIVSATIDTYDTQSSIFQARLVVSESGERFI